MSKYRRAARIDDNQPEIVRKLRELGYSVETGHDDLLIGHNGKTYWIELKDPKKTLNKDGTYKAGAIKPSQVILNDEWQGHYEIVHSIEQIIEILNG